MKPSHTRLPAALLPTLLLLAGCSTTFTNLTPERLPQNPSNIYTLSHTFRPAEADIVADSIEAEIVIDGDTRPMKPAPHARNTFEYEYRMPAHRSEAAYYFVTRYQVESRGSRTHTSPLYSLKLINRYVLTMHAERGPVGALIPILGRGFSPHDRVLFDGSTEAETRFESPNALNFRVPPLPANRTYTVEIATGAGNLLAGEFRIDAATLHVSPASLTLRTGQRATLLFSIDHIAPYSGIPLDITTNIPTSLIMPEASLPGGARTVSIPIEGASVGSGTLYVNASGFGEVAIPVTVTE